MPKPTLGVCYYPEHWPRAMWADDARRMVETGISVVRIGEFAWSRIEPARGKLDFEWLDKAIETLTDAGLTIIFCTPTATPPKWLVDEMPDMLALDEQGRKRGFGSRRHYDIAHRGYRRECVRIVEILAERYGDHPSITAWQTDNEYGCHDTTLSYGMASRDGFRNWLAQKYQSPEALNRAWGNVFWSMEVGSFEEIDPPNLTVTEPNPSHVLDFRRFASDQVVAFNKVQADIIRRHAPGRDIVHNFMGREMGFDHHDVSADLDVASWDSYPLGFLERHGRDDAWKRWYLRAGDPDFQAFHHDLYRGCTMRRSKGNSAVRGSTVAPNEKNSIGRWSVMEQQPGAVNWAPWNPAPHPGMVRAWTHEAFAHGAEMVSYFRWRQAPFAQEQFHAGLNLPDNTPDIALAEVRQVADEIARLPDARTEQAPVALIFDYPSQWATDIQPQGADYDGFDLTMRFYSALRRAGQNVDIVPARADLSGYALIVVPHLLMVPEDFATRCGTVGVLFGPRSGSRTHGHHVPANLAPGPLEAMLGLRIPRVESLRPNATRAVGRAGALERWAEDVSVIDADILLSDDEGRPVWTLKGHAAYLAGWPDETLADHIIHSTLKAAGLVIVETGDDLRIRDRGALRTIINYGPQEQDGAHLIGPHDTILIGSKTLPVAGITIVQRI